MALSPAAVATAALVGRRTSPRLSPALVARRHAHVAAAGAGPSGGGLGYSHAREGGFIPTLRTRYDFSSNDSSARLSPTRPFSSVPPPPTAIPPGGSPDGLRPPTSLTPEAGMGAQDAMRLFIQHGLGKQKLEQIAATKDGTPLVDRWQKMIATYLETQCHVIALLGYQPNEQGIAMYTQHLTQSLQLSPPEVQESLRVAGRDTYRMVLAAAFDVPNLVEDQAEKGELPVVDARNIMHKVSLRMQEPDVLEKVAKRCGEPVAMNDSPEAKQIELARKHTVVQQVMVEDVYLARNDGGESLVEECGFGEGEGGYVRMQSAMAEHQGDPLIAQYVGSAMVRLLQSAGIDMEALQREAREIAGQGQQQASSS